MTRKTTSSVQQVELNVIRIFQINSERDVDRVLFCDLAHFKKYHMNGADEFDLSIYNEVYSYKSDEDDLESIFSIFNIDRPDDFTGHSLSVSDVVQINDRYFYCDRAGWCEITQLINKPNKT